MTELQTGYFTHSLAGTYEGLAISPEKPERIEAIENQLIAGGLERQFLREEAPSADIDTVALAHDREYLDTLREESIEGSATSQSPDTRITKGTYECAMKSAGQVVAAVKAVVSGRLANAFCAVRPPGHHALRNRANGFCFINNVAVGALYAVAQLGLKRVAIVDFDAHHGDGTEDIVSGHPDIRFFSFFQHPLFPHTGINSQAANVVNRALVAGDDGEKIRQIVDMLWVPELLNYRPELILVSAGFDGHSEEPVAQLKLMEFDYAYITRRLVEVADQVCQGRLVSVLEGGYHLRSLARSVMVHLQTLARLS